MKTPIKSNATHSRRRLTTTLLTLSAGLMLPTLTAMAQTEWIGTTGDYTNPASWSGTFNGGSNPNTSNDNGSNNVVLIQPGDPLWQHGDTLAGNANGTSGAYLQTGSTNDSGGGNWLRMGIGSGSYGQYILSNGVVNVGGRTQLGENGAGYLEIDGGVYNGNVNDGGANPSMVCGQGDAGPGTGTLVINGGIVSYANETWFGEQPDTGYFFMNGGTLNVNNWFVFGRNGGKGFGTMTGGTINFHGGGQFLIGGGGVGSLAQSGGIINAYNQYLVPQSDGGSGASGTNILSGTAVLNVHDWIAVGRNSGYGEMDISGSAALTRDNINNGNDSNSHFDIGGGGVGVLNQNGGTITELTSDFWIGESAKATWNLNSGNAHLQNVVMAVNNGVNSTLNLNGGLLQANSIRCPSSGSFATLNLNGGTLQANSSTPTFVNGLYRATVGGNSTIDSQGYNIGIPQALLDNGGGSLTKIGSGSLTLTGANSYSGSTTISAGTLNTTTASSGGGDYALAGGTALNVQVVGGLNGTLAASSLTFSGPANTLGIDLNSFGNPTTAPLTVGALTNNGTVTINIASSAPTVSQFPLISYTSTTPGFNYVLGPLPPGVSANLVNDTSNHSIDLNIYAVSFLRWEGNAGGNWDIGKTTNWINLVSGLGSYFGTNDVIVFDDNAVGTTNVNIVTNVVPAEFTINNSSLIYTLSGTGSVNGASGLLKEGTSSATIVNSGLNGYTGPTVIAGGTLNVTNLANGGSPSAIGAASVNPTNLVLSGGTLAYSGLAVSINRGYTSENTNGTVDLNLAANLTLNGSEADYPGSGFVKSGPALLTYAGSGSGTLADTLGYSIAQGSVQFAGQTNSVAGNFEVAGPSLGFPTPATTYATLGVSGTASLTIGGLLDVGDSANDSINTTGVVTQTSGTLVVNSPTQIGQYPNGVGYYNLSGGTLDVNSWLVIGREGAFGTMTMSGGVIYDTGGGGNMDIGTSAGVGGYSGTGILNQTGGAITNTASEVWLGEGATGEPANGTWNMSGGSAVLGEVHVGVGGTGTSTLNVSGSANITESYLLLANYDGATTANVNMGDPLNPGGTVTVNADMDVGGQGTSTLNFATNGGGKLTVTGTLYLSRFSATANGTINLNTGGTLVAAYINNGWGFQNNLASPTDNPNALNFNGGTLKAYVGSAYFIQPYVNAVVQPAGAIIDDGGFSIDVLAPLVTGGGGGGLTKQGNGTLHLDGVNTYTGTTLVNSGSLGVGPGGVIAGPVVVASGATLDGNIGAIGSPFSINNTLTLNSGSTTYIQITPSSNDEIIGLTSVNYGGALVVTNISGSPLTAGKQYLLFNAAGAGTGHFSSITVLSSTGSYTGTFNTASGILTIGSGAPPILNSPTVSAGNLTLTGSGGTPSGTYSLLSSTNVTTPWPLWVTNTTGVFSATGTFTNVIPISHTTPAQFFDVKTP